MKRRCLGTCFVSASLLLCAGCSELLSKPAVQPSYYALDSLPTTASTAAAGVLSVRSPAPTLIIDPPSAAPGYDSTHMIYTRGSHSRAYFSHNEWVDRPARMFAPLLVAAIERGGAFRAVVPPASVAVGDFRLDTQIVRLEQDFSHQPSQVHLTLRAYLLDEATHRVIAWREFNQTVPAVSDDPYGGVVAANRAAQRVLEGVVGFCAEAIGSWQPPAPQAP